MPPDAEEAYSYLLGLYLGDGHISEHRRGVFRMRIFMDERYGQIIRATAEAIAAVAPGNRVGIQQLSSKAVAIYAYSKRWACLFPQHGPGPKHQRAIVLAEWQRAITTRHPRAFVRGLIHSDGCRFTNRVVVGGKRYEYVRYSFTNVSPDIHALFCEHLDLLGIDWRVMNARNISVARRAAVAKLDQFVGPKS